MIFLILLQNRFSVKIHPPHPLTYQEPSLALQTTVRCCTMSVKCSAETHSTPPSRSQVTPDMNILTTEGKCVSVFPGAAPGAPAVYLNTSSGEGRKVLEAARTAGCPPFTLVAISGLDWNRDMAPWDSPAAFRKGEPFTGGADDYLRLLAEEIFAEGRSRAAHSSCMARNRRVLAGRAVCPVRHLSDRSVFPCRVYIRLPVVS